MYTRNSQSIDHIANLCRNRVATVGTALETVVGTVVSYIETVEFLDWRPDLDPLDQKITVSM